MNTKFVAAFLLSISLLTVSATDEDFWRVLHATSQNLARKLSLKKGAQDVGIFDPELSKIDQALKELVKSGDLSEKVFEFEFKGSLDDFFDSFNESDNLDKLINKYGVYTLSEMLDIGKFFRGADFKNDGKVALKVRLPAKDLEIFSGALDDLLK
jgi:hypothetical protein